MRGNVNGILKVGVVVDHSKAGEMIEIKGTAYLSNDRKYTCFSYLGKNIRFRTSDRLIRYQKVLKWDRGYLEVLAEYEGFSGPVEEFIDLIPILNNLFIDSDEFLSQIEKVEVKDDGNGETGESGGHDY